MNCNTLKIKQETTKLNDIIADIKREIKTEDEYINWDEAERVYVDDLPVKQGNFVLVKAECFSTEKHCAIAKHEHVLVDDSNEFEEYIKTKCNICHAEFSSTDDLLEHRRKPSIEKTYACCACYKTFRDMCRLNVHRRGHTGEKPYVCDICTKPFSIKSNLRKHIRIHTGERRFECDMCERKFIQFAHLTDHQRKHTGEKPFKCIICDQLFTSKSRLNTHRKTNHLVTNHLSG